MVDKCFKIYMAAVSRLLEKAFVKLSHPWYDLIINLIRKSSPQSLSPICHEKLLEEGPYILFGKRHYDLAPLENHVGVYTPSIFARNWGLKLLNILNLAKRVVWQNKSVG